MRLNFALILLLTVAACLLSTTRAAATPLQTTSTTSTTNQQQPQQQDEAQIHAKSLMNWIRAHGGYVSDKLEIRRRADDGILGVFTTQDLAPDEIVMKIPRHCYFSLDVEEMSTVFLDLTVPTEVAMKDYYQNICKLAHKLNHHLQAFQRDRDPSRHYYGPYLAYLTDQPRGQLPATFSQAAKTVFRTLLGNSDHHGNATLPPFQLVDWMDEQFVKTECVKDEPAVEHAVALILQRGFDAELIPLYDMVNHDNGKRNTNTNSLRSDEGLRLWAMEPISAGEELFMTYDYCTDCLEVGADWGTPGILRDFGFVESYPQEWPFMEQGYDMTFMVDYNVDNDHFVARFHDDEFMPDNRGLLYMQRELHRLTHHFDLQQELRNLENSTTASNNNTGIRPHEIAVIEQYHRALVIALQAGIEATLKLQQQQQQQQQQSDDTHQQARYEPREHIVTAVPLHHAAVGL